MDPRRPLLQAAVGVERLIVRVQAGPIGVGGFAFAGKTAVVHLARLVGFVARQGQAGVARQRQGAVLAGAAGAIFIPGLWAAVALLAGRRGHFAAGPPILVGILLAAAAAGAGAL